MEEIIKKFLSVSYGYGSGSGYDYSYDDDYGYGDGACYDFGKGYGFGSGEGTYNGLGFGRGPGSVCSYDDILCSGSSSGYGYVNSYVSNFGSCDGYGHGIKEFNYQKVYIIDNVPTLINSVHGNYAIGKILNNNLTTTPCFIVKVENFFAHGETLKQALDDAQKKYKYNKPVEERIAYFIKQYPSLDSIAEHSDLYHWHNILTGSCTFGRDIFAIEHNIDKNNGTMTIREFINLTRNAYGGNIIKRLEETYK